MDRSLDDIISEKKMGRQNKKPSSFAVRNRPNGNKKPIQRRSKNRNVRESRMDARSKIIRNKRSKLLVSDARELINKKLVAEGHDARELLFRKRNRNESRGPKVFDARERIHLLQNPKGSRRMALNPTMLRREIINDRRGMLSRSHADVYDDLSDEEVPIDVHPTSVRITTHNNLARLPQTTPIIPQPLRITTTNRNAKKRRYSDESSPPSSRRWRDDSPKYRTSPLYRSGKYESYSSSRSSGKSHGLFQSLSKEAQKPIAFKVLISNLHPTQVTEEDISELFSELGYIESVRLLSGGEAEVIYEAESDAERAVEEYNHRLLDGRAMKCKMMPVYPDSGLSKISSGDAGVSPDVGLIHRALFKKQNVKVLSSSRPGLH